HLSGNASTTVSFWTSAGEALAASIGVPASNAARAFNAPARKLSYITPCTGGPAASRGIGAGSAFAASSMATRARAGSMAPGGAAGTAAGGGAGTGTRTSTGAPRVNVTEPVLRLAGEKGSTGPGAPVAVKTTGTICQMGDGTPFKVAGSNTLGSST